MIAQRNDIVSALHGVWPNLVDGMPYPSNLAIPDETYWLPKRSHLERVITVDWTERRAWLREIWDCDDFAFQFMCHIRNHVYELIVDSRIHGPDAAQWAVGECWGTRFRKQDTGHAINVAITEDAGVLLIEPQTDEIWEPIRGEDLVHYIRM